MQVREIMTENPVCCTPDTNLQEVARLMLDNDCGLIPVVDNQENKKPIGTITDRDIAIRTVATGQNPIDVKASNVMTMGVTTVKPETGVQECCDVMENKKIRRVLVVDNSGAVCGIVAQADVAAYAQPELISDMVEEISESAPTPNRGRTARSTGTNFNSSNRSFSTNRSFSGTGQKKRVRSNQASFLSLKSLLPLAIGIGTGAALKYFLIPQTENKRRLTVNRHVPVGSTQTTNKRSTDLSDREVIPSTNTTDVVTGTVNSADRESNSKTDTHFTDGTTGGTGTKRAAG